MPGPSAHRVAFEEGSGPRVLLKSGPGNRGRSACGPTHVARLEFPRVMSMEHQDSGEIQAPSRHRVQLWASDLTSLSDDDRAQVFWFE